MKQNSKQALTPKLRFPEFRDEPGWTEKRLADAATLISERAKNKECTPFTVSSGIGLVSQQERFGRTIAGTQLKNYFLLRKNDFAYNKSATKSFPEGFIARYLGDGPAAVPNSIFTCFRLDEHAINPGYLDYLFSSNLHGKWLKKFITVGARAHGSLNVSDADLLALPVPLPSGATSLVEQQRIADCLSSLDELIAAGARKVEALKAQRQGLMQQLFPRNGETVPRLRFPEFRDSAGWEETLVGAHVDLISGYPFEGKTIVEVPNGSQLLRGINITEGRIRHNATIDRYFPGDTTALEAFRVKSDDLVIGMDGSKVGRNSALISDVDSGALLVQRVARLRTQDPILIRFIFLQINSTRFHAYVDRISTSSGIPHISAKQIKEFQIYLPSRLEQKALVECLSALDAQIAAQTENVRLLKTHKAGLMQQLFPSPEELEA